MADPLVAIANYFQDNNVGTIGTTIFVNEMPSQCQQGLLIYSFGDGLMRHTEISGYYRGSIMVVSRAANVNDGYSLIEKVLNIMDKERINLGSLTILTSKPEALPQSFAENDGGFTEWLLPLELCLITN